MRQTCRAPHASEISVRAIIARLVLAIGALQAGAIPVFIIAGSYYVGWFLHSKSQSSTVKHPPHHDHGGWASVLLVQRSYDACKMTRRQEGRDAANLARAADACWVRRVGYACLSAL